MRNSVTVILLTTVILCISCGGQINFQQEKDEPDYHMFHVNTDSYCGDNICNGEEDYWSCLDCVDPFTGGPKHGYCGDHICFNETQLTCWKDCSPEPYNSDPEDGEIKHPKVKFPEWPGPLPPPKPIPE